MVVVALGGIFWFTQKPQSRVVLSEEGNKPKIMVSFFPYGEFARAVAGDLAMVSEIVPSGVEPHDFEPTPRDIEQLYQANVVILNGAGIDAWAEKLAPALEERGIRVIRMVDAVPLIPSTTDDEEDTEFPHEGFDPHFWLDPVLAERQVEKIAAVMSEVDALHAEEYREQARISVRELQTLDQQYREGLAQCRLRSVVTTHDAFIYLAKRYTLEVIPIAGISPNAEPSPKRLTEIAEKVRERDIRVIFFETLSSPKLAETLAREVGVRTLVFNPIEGSVPIAGHRASYFELMQENLENLKIALECL